MDDPTLVQRATEGEAEAFAAIYDRYAGPLHDFLWWVLQDRRQADAALVDTFAAAGSRLGELADPAKLRSWLFAIAAAEALHGQRPESEDSEPEDNVVADGGEFTPVVLAAAEQLTPQERVLLDLRYRQGFEGQELGDVLGVRPDYADSHVRDLTDRVDSSLGPALATRFSRKKCAVVNAMVAEYEGPPDEGLRQRIAVHAEDCQICADWRRRIGIATVLAVAPTLALPAILGERVLQEVDLGGEHTGTGRHWLRRRRGFPPPLVADRDRRRLGAAVATATVVVAGVGGFLLTRDNPTQEVASVGSTTSSTRRALPSTVPTSTTVPTTSTTVDSAGGAGGGATSGSGGSGTSATTTGSAGSSGGGGTGSGVRTGASGTSSSPSSPSSPDPEPPVEVTETTTTLPPATTPPDETKPSLSGVRISPSTLRSTGQCANGDPTQATVTVDASDASGLAAVTVTVAVSGAPRVAMTPTGGGGYTATVGPFTSPLESLNRDFTTQVVVQAVDASPNANTAGATTDVTLRCTEAA